MREVNSGCCIGELKNLSKILFRSIVFSENISKILDEVG